MKFLLVRAFLVIGLFGGVIAEYNALLQAAEDAPPAAAAQTTPESPVAPEAAPQPTPPPTSQIEGLPRNLAPGVLVTIPPDVQVDETHNRQDIVELVTLDSTF